MNVIHIVPSAFEYFEDIRAAAFTCVEALDKRGVTSEIITLQYGAPTRAERRTALEQEVKRSYTGVIPHDQLLGSLSSFDIIHFHTPGLGFLGKFLKWQRNNSAPIVVVSYYRSVRLNDMISRLINWYNKKYLPQLAGLASGIIYFSEYRLRSLMLKMSSEALVVNAMKYTFEPLTENAGELTLIHQDKLAEDIIALYSQLMYTTKKSYS